MTDTQMTEPHYSLPERAGSSAAHELATLGGAMEPGTKLVLAADKVRRMSCSVVITLISLARTASQNGGGVVIRAPQSCFTDAFSDLGLFEALMSMEFSE